MASVLIVGPSRVFRWPQFGIFLLVWFVLKDVDVLFAGSLEVFNPVTMLSELKVHHVFMKRLSQRNKGWRLTAILGVALTIGTLLILGESLPIWAAKRLAVLGIIFCVLWGVLILELLVRQLFSFRSKYETESSALGKPDLNT
jgi:hypothetical protein